MRKKKALIRLWDAACPKFHEESGKFPDVPLIFGTAGEVPGILSRREQQIKTYDSKEGLSESEFIGVIEQISKSNSDNYYPARRFGKAHFFSAKKYGKWRALELKKKYNRGKNNPPL